MKTELFKIGAFSVHGYGFMIGVGFLLAMLVGEMRARRKGMRDEVIIDIAILAGVFGFLGAKLLYIIVSFKEFIADPIAVIGSSGFVVYGGIISGVAAAAIYCRIKKLDFMAYFDLVMPEIAIAQGFGRIGCFLAGCCYGRQTDSWLGVVFPQGSMAPAGVKLLPTQLFSSVGDFLIAVILIVLADIVFEKHKNAGEEEKAFSASAFGRVSGDIGSLYLFMYGAGRFVIEFFRDDYRGGIGFLSTSQFISVFIVAAGAAVMVLNRRNIRKSA